MMKNVKTKKNKFNQLNKKIQDDQLTKILTISGELVLSDATRLVPVDTGRLKSSLNYVVNDDSVTIGTNVEYAKKMEYGGSKQAPNGYLRPAFYKNEDKIKSMFEKFLNRWVKV